MARVRWTAKARDDLHAIRTFLARTSPGHAQVVEDALLAATARLAAFPRSGRAVPEVGDPEIREVLHRHYRIVYHVDADDEVTVLSVVHSSRDWGVGR